MPYADRRSHRLYYETLGADDAPPLLLIMGMGFSSRAWGSLPQRFAESFRVVVFDNRGSGRSTAPFRPFRVRDMADDAAAVLDAAGVGSAHVFGISLGGMVALELALRHPARVRAQVLGATFEGWARSRKPTPPAIGDVVLGSVLSRLGAHRMIGKVLVSDELLESDLPGLGAWISSGERVPPRILLQQMTAVTLHSTAGRLRDMKVPTLVLTGDRDRLVPEENSRRLAQSIPGARLVVLPGAGHCFPLERFHDTLREVTRFFGGLAAAPRAGAAAAGGKR